MEVILPAFLGLSVALNAVLAALLSRKKRQKTPELTLSAEDLLHDLTTRGQAVLRVEVIDVKNLLLRSPRG